MMPRVSTLLSILYPGSLDFVPEDALERGTRLHAYMEEWVKYLDQPGRWAALDGFTIQEQTRLLACREWVLNAGLTYISAEELYSSHLGFSGHPDLVARWKRKVFVFDWKFAHTLTEQNLIQAEAYRHLVPDCQGVALVKVAPDGTVIVCKLKPRPDLWAVFLNAKAVHAWRNR